MSSSNSESLTSRGRMVTVSPDCRHTLDDIKALLDLSKRVVVILGAGISTAAGIPDFRSKNGLYANGDLFSQTSMMDSRSRAQLQRAALSLYEMAVASEPTETHKLVVALRDGGSLLRCYTQNIDMLEERAGLAIDLERVDVECVQLHGSLRHLRCGLCSRVTTWEDFKGDILKDQDVACPYCVANSETRAASGKRRTSIGRLAPDIIRIGQVHSSGERIADLANADQAAQPDLLFILGTSLKAHGAKMLAKHFARATRAFGGKVVLVDIAEPRYEIRGFVDFWVQWECDAWAMDIMQRSSIVARSYVGRPGSTLDNPIILE